MSELYSIKDTTLTALGDAVRNKTSKYITVDEPTMEPISILSINTKTISPVITDDRMYNYYSEIIDLKEVCGEDLYEQVKKIYINFDYETETANGYYMYLYWLNSKDYEDKNDSITIDNSNYSQHPATNNGTIIISKTTQYCCIYVCCWDFTVEANRSLKLNLQLWPCDNSNQFFKLNTYTPLEMADKINGLMTIPDEALNLTGDCQYRFAYGSNDWLINTAGDKITTKDISNANYMFQKSKVEYIPFEINMTGTSISSIFDGCQKLKEVPVINMPSPRSPIDFNYNFRDCYSIREVPEWFCDLLEQSYNSGKAGAFGPFENVFQNCRSLRKIPEKAMKYMAINGTPSGYYYTMVYGKPFSNCSCLDELIGISCDNYAFTSNQFASFFAGLWHAKDVTFETNEDGTPVVRSWKAQTLDFTQNIGWVNGIGDVDKMTDYNSGITADKEVTDDATYQALKDDPDWFSANVNYSRYNHDSAVNTINSLPDCSASGGTNTIKFYGTAGALTDGGAINTLTEEEIAVATAKGWTVSLV